MTGDIDRLREAAKGQTTALITPFNKHGAVDLAGVDDHVQLQLAEAVPLILAGGTIGEASLLSREDRHRLTKCVVGAARGRAIVGVGVTAERPDEVLSYVRAARGAGADFVMAAVPATFRLTDDELVSYWQWFDEHTTLPYLLYATTTTATPPPSPAVLRRVATQARGLIGIKDPTPDLDRLRRLSETLNMPIITASEKVLPSAFGAGAVACMTATSCFAPDVVARVVQAATQQDHAAADRAYQPIAAFRALFQDRMDAGFPAYLPYTKAACEAVGLSAGSPRRPLSPISAHQRTALDAVLATHFPSPISAPSI